ncbi:MAG: hypothetical protein QW220_04065 [Candidatus Bathyarchaeia archaeon]
MESLIYHSLRAWSKAHPLHDKSLLKPPERLSKEVKCRLKDFDLYCTFLVFCDEFLSSPSSLYVPCRCGRPFMHIKSLLEE